MKSELGGPSDSMEVQSSAPEGFDPNARVEVGENSQHGETGAADNDLNERSDKTDAVEANGDSSDADVPEPDQDGAEGDGTLDKLFSKLENLCYDMHESHEADSWDWVDKLYTSLVDRLKQVAYTDAKFVGTPTDFMIKPNLETLRGREANQKMQEFGVSEIHCVKGVVDFSSVSVAQTTIDGMTSDLRANKKLGFEAFAEQFNKERPLPDGEKWTASKVKEWASLNRLDFHESSDMRTVQLVPREIHQYIRHLGGRKECSVRDGEKVGGNGGFDD